MPATAQPEVILRRLALTSGDPRTAQCCAGYGYYRPNIRLFDPGWKGPQMKGPEDETVLAEDNGNDPLGLVYRWVLPAS